MNRDAITAAWIIAVFAERASLIGSPLVVPLRQPVVKALAASPFKVGGFRRERVAGSGNDHAVCAPGGSVCGLRLIRLRIGPIGPEVISAESLSLQRGAKKQVS
jgi:hypothetical protein